MAGKPLELGHQILLYEGSDGDIISALEMSHNRFLDVLWIPVPLGHLSPAQIVITNRFRESRIDSDPQFKKATKSREAFLHVLSDISPSYLVEVGCGKFPMYPVRGCDRFLGIDIDAEAISWCVENGFDVRNIEDSIDDKIADVIIASYVFHFSVSDELIACLERISRDECLLMFNLIADSTDHVLGMLGRMSSIWPVIKVVKENGMPRREYWVVMSRLAGESRLRVALAALKEAWANQLV